jgi:N-methylhydantoinase A
VATRIGVDVGGTFTDLVLYDDESGRVEVEKQPTTPEAPERGVVAAVAGAVPDELLRRARYFVHGTTVGLNSLLERRGATVGLLATRGFRDVLEIRRGDRGDMYDLFWRQPPPLVPRRLRLPVTERVLADGSVRVPIDLEDVRAAARAFLEEGVDCVAVAFLHAYANPSHELAAAGALREAGFAGELSLSHAVSGEYREYERTSTTVIDAFVRPRMSRYIASLEEGLRRAGFDGDALMTRSGGGALSFAEAESRPFETILSGPVAGAEAAAQLARELGIASAVTADVGGTSFDTALVLDGRTQLLYEGQIGGMPLQTPWIDVRSVGAGGGSVAYVDRGGLLQVGPRSAGAVPGPACYGRGGAEPTVTDAALLLGMLGEGRLAAGLRLDREAARRAVAPLREALGFASSDDVARGVVTIAAVTMANAIREISIERGHDPRESTLIAFGGAGPLFAVLLARELGIPRVAVPLHAGNFSASGLLGADLAQGASRTRILRLGAAGLAEASALLADLFASLDGGGGRREARLDMRYVGQEHSLTIAVPYAGSRLTADAEEVRRLFTAAYRRTFAHAMEEEVEIVSLRAEVSQPLASRRERRVEAHGDAAAGSVEAHSFAEGAPRRFALVRRGGLAAGARLEGPAIVVEPTATTYLDAGWRGSVLDGGTLLLEAC